MELNTQEKIDRLLDWVQEYRHTFTAEAMDTGSGDYLMRKLDSKNLMLLSMKFEKVKPTELVIGRFCNWMQMDPMEDSRDYDTGCGKAFSLIDGTLGENDMRYCTYCGKPINDVTVM